MYPILYDSTEKDFSNNGLGIIQDCVSSKVTEELNGAFEASFEYPCTGTHFSEIKLRNIILAKPNPFSNPQPFRIDEISRPMNGVVKVHTNHISYDLSGIPVTPFTAQNAADAMSKLDQNAAVENNFSHWTDKTTTANMTVSLPSSSRSLLGGVEGSVLDVYGGEYEWDKFTVKLHAARGQNRGVSIRYGKNLTDISQEENCSNVYTGVYPYWTGQNGEFFELSSKIVPVDGTFNFTRILILDFSGDFEEKPTETQLTERAKTYIKSNSVGVPKVSLTVSFAQLEQTEEYKDLKLLENVSLGDTVNVEFPSLGVSANAKCIKTVYDPIMERYESVSLGDAKASLSDTISNQQKELENVPSKSFLENAVTNATNQITGNLGGYVVLHSSTGGDPDEILIMDTPSIETAVKVWRFNKAGLGYSKSGYNGPYGLAMTQDGAIVADFITTGTLNAANIEVLNLVAQGVNLSGEFNAENGNYKAKFWAGLLRILHSNHLRSRMYSTASDDPLASSGVIHVCTGNTSEDGELLDSTAKNTSITANSVRIGEDKDGNYNGYLYCKVIDAKNTYTNNIYLNGKIRPNPDTNALEVDWVQIKDISGNTKWALCGK